MINKKNIILIILPIVALIVTAFVMGLNVSDKAFADAYVEVDSVTAAYLSGFDENAAPQFVEDADYGVYFSGTAPYAKDIKVSFSLASDVRYYKIERMISGATTDGGMIVAPTSGTVEYSVDGSGTFVVTCYGYSDTYDLLGQASATVKSDLDLPVGPTANQMTDWIAEGVSFDAILDWSGCGDALSGVKAVFYRVYYDDGTVSAWKKLDPVPVDKTYVALTKSGKITVMTYDQAGNYSKNDFVFNKFDGVAPKAPYYEVSPAVESGKYSHTYTITLGYQKDNESGLAPVQHYLMNGVSYAYEDGVGIVLEEQKNYSFVFYAMDNVGNRSSYSSYDLPGTAFDVKGPYLDPNEIKTEIDLTNEDGICLLTFTASDYKESGIKSASIAGKDYVLSVRETDGYNLYSLRYDCLEDHALRIVLTDNAGNVTEHQLILDYFSDSSFNSKIKRLVSDYRELDREKLSESAKNRIDDAYMSLNYLLNTSGNTYNEFEKAANNAAGLMKNVAEIKYVIASVPQYASSLVTFNVDQKDFSDYYCGNTLEIVMKKEEGDDSAFVDKTTFSRGFCDYFSLQLSVEGQPLSAPLTKGIEARMALPNNYVDRNFALYNAKTGEEIPTTTINNNIVFTFNDSTSFAFVISGAKAPTEYAEPDDGSSITVFGRKWPMSSFLGIVLGVGGGAIVLIVLLLLIGKRRG